MKVYQIISEGNVLQFPTKQTTLPKPPPPVRDPALRAQRIAQAAELRRQGGPKSARKVGGIVKQRHNIWKVENAKAAAKMESSFWAKLGTSTGLLFKWLGLGAAITELYIDLAGLEELYLDKELTKEEYEAEREFAFGIFEVQIIAPAVVRFVANSRIVLMLVRLIKNVVLGAGAVAGVVTGGVVSAASIAAMIATEAGIAAFQMWLGSEQGKTVLAKQFGGIIRKGGYVGEGIWNKLLYAFSDSSFYKDAEKKQGKFQNQKALDTAKTPQEKQAAQQAISAAQTAADKEADMAAGMKDLK